MEVRLATLVFAISRFVILDINKRERPAVMKEITTITISTPVQGSEYEMAAM